LHFSLTFAATGRKDAAAWELAVLLQGIDLSKGKKWKRRTLPVAMSAEKEEERRAPRNNFIFLVGRAVFFPWQMPIAISPSLRFGSV
jgi:hypothetical protein